VATPLGEVHAAVSAAGVVATSLPGETLERFVARLRELAPGVEVAPGGNALLRDVLTQLREFFVGKRTRFDLPIDLRATPFTRRVLDALAQVPCGETRTYGSLAKSIGAPGAARAVGTALSKNPIPIILPCHRVVATNSIGGFAGKARAIDVKRALLELEA
jgi:methylated-DNA-[protein]-cysteine S-methyltransferase